MQIGTFAGVEKMLALIGQKPLYGWNSSIARFTFGPSLKRAASAIGWGLAIGIGAMLAEVVAVLGTLYAAGIVSY